MVINALMPIGYGCQKLQAVAYTTLTSVGKVHLSKVSRNQCRSSELAIASFLRRTMSCSADHQDLLAYITKGGASLCQSDQRRTFFIGQKLCHILVSGKSGDTRQAALLKSMFLWLRANEISAFVQEFDLAKCCCFD